MSQIVTHRLRKGNNPVRKHAHLRNVIACLTAEGSHSLQEEKGAAGGTNGTDRARSTLVGLKSAVFG